MCAVSSLPSQFRVLLINRSSRISSGCLLNSNLWKMLKGIDKNPNNQRRIHSDSFVLRSFEAQSLSRFATSAPSLAQAMKNGRPGNLARIDQPNSISGRPKFRGEPVGYRNYMGPRRQSLQSLGDEDILKNAPKGLPKFQLTPYKASLPSISSKFESDGREKPDGNGGSLGRKRSISTANVAEGDGSNGESGELHAVRSEADVRKIVTRLTIADDLSGNGDFVTSHLTHKKNSQHHPRTSKVSDPQDLLGSSSLRNHSEDRPTYAKNDFRDIGDDDSGNGNQLIDQKTSEVNMKNNRKKVLQRNKTYHVIKPQPALERPSIPADENLDGEIMDIED